MTEHGGFQPSAMLLQASEVERLEQANKEDREEAERLTAEAKSRQQTVRYKVAAHVFTVGSSRD